MEKMKKISFITEDRLYSFVVIQSGLKKIGATYQRLIDKMFKDLIGKTVKIYIETSSSRAREREIISHTSKKSLVDLPIQHED